MQKIIITFLFLLNCCINYLQAQNVGIGLGNGVFPVHKLQVNDGNIGLYNSQDDKLIKFEYDPILNYFAIKEATGVNGVGLNRMLFQDGMVGIGKIPIYSLDVAGYIHADNSIFSDGSINSLSNISANGYVNAIGGLYSSTSGTIATNFYVGGNITTGASSDATIGNNLNVGQNILVGTDGTDRGILSNYTSSPGSQLKFHMTDFTFTAILGPHAISAETSIAWTNGIFTSQPAVTVAQVTSTGGTTGQLYMVNLQLYNCDTNSCNARLVNLSSGNVNYSVTYRVQMIGY